MVPPISVVIPTYNRARELERALRSVQSQTILPYEVIVCDDGSSDETRELVQRIRGPVPVIYCYQQNSGLPACARNLGVRRSRGEFVAFLDSDDWWVPEKVEQVLKAGLAECDVVYHPLIKVPSTSKFKGGRFARSRPLRHPVFDDLLRRGNVIPNSSAVVRRSTLLQVGGLNESVTLRSWEDFDLWLRIAQVSDNFRFVDTALGFYSTLEGISNASQTLENLENFLLTWGTLRGQQPAWLRQQRAVAHAELGDHSAALEQSLKALSSPSSLRFRLDFILGMGLCCREALRAIKGSDTSE